MLKVPNAACPTPVVRNWATRRVRDAFIRALREKGLGRDGLVQECRNEKGVVGEGEDGASIRSIITTDGMKDHESECTTRSRVAGRTTPKETRQPHATMEMQGSLVIRVELQAAKASSPEVDEEARALVDWLYQNGVRTGSAA